MTRGLCQRGLCHADAAFRNWTKVSDSKPEILARASESLTVGTQVHASYRLSSADLL